MSTSLLIILAFGAVVASWAVLTLLGGERARRLGQIEAKRQNAPAQPKLLSVPSDAAGVAKPSSIRKPKPAKPQAAAKNPR
jgi:hypothetical protein